MKNLHLILLLALFTSVLANAQELIETKIYSNFVGDSVPIKIWLPRDYDESEHYPTIYEFIYDHSNYIAATASNIWDIPKVIVVWAKIEGGNEHYSSPNLTDIGNKYYAFVKNELIDYISKNYNTSKLKIATGLSQGADYVNYILRNDPSLFDRYMIF